MAQIIKIKIKIKKLDAVDTAFEIRAILHSRTLAQASYSSKSPEIINVNEGRLLPLASLTRGSSSSSVNTLNMDPSRDASTHRRAASGGLRQQLGTSSFNEFASDSSQTNLLPSTSAKGNTSGSINATSLKNISAIALEGIEKPKRFLASISHTSPKRPKSPFQHLSSSTPESSPPHSVAGSPTKSASNGHSFIRSITPFSIPTKDRRRNSKRYSIPRGHQFAPSWENANVSDIPLKSDSHDTQFMSPTPDISPRSLELKEKLSPRMSTLAFPPSRCYTLSMPPSHQYSTTSTTSITDYASRTTFNTTNGNCAQPLIGDDGPDSLLKLSKLSHEDTTEGKWIQPQQQQVPRNDSVIEMSNFTLQDMSTLRPMIPIND